MGKSAQVPLHVWLPDSMEGPTPISALIHAATMVTAGIFMVARMSPLFELSETALSFMLIIGATTAFFMGLLGVVNNDIKRVVAYSTLSQLGYMTVALGVSAYGAGIFHLMTHAFFKALLFLAAGSVIIAMHHEQDMRKMGGLRKYMPITYWTCLVGSLALIGFPGTSGFFSKDSLIDAVHASHRFGRRLRLFLRAHGRLRHRALHVPHVLHDVPRQGAHGSSTPRITCTRVRWVVTVPLMLLAIPSALIGWFTVKPVLFGDFFGGAIHVLPANDVLEEVGEEFHGPGAFVWRPCSRRPPSIWSRPACSTAWLFFYGSPALADAAERRSSGCTASWSINTASTGSTSTSSRPFARALGTALWRVGDEIVIDGGWSTAARGWWAGSVR